MLDNLERNDSGGLLQQIIKDDDIEEEGELLGIGKPWHIIEEKKDIEHYDETVSSESESLIETPRAKKPNDHHDLKIVYSKLLIPAIIVSIICIAALITGLIHDFYTWRGITFNSIVIFASFIGIFCGIYMDDMFNQIYLGEDPKFKIFKLKLLLSYFLLCIWFTIIIFIIEFVYLIIIPIRMVPKINTNDEIIELTVIMISYFCGIILYLILLSFYIDIIARGCIKRGRIEWIINYIKSERSSFCYIFRNVLAFRKHFRSFRAILTKITAIKFINYSVEHQNSLKDVFIEPGIQPQQNKLDVLHDKYSELEDNTKRCCNKCCYKLNNCWYRFISIICDRYFILRFIICLVLIYLFFPLVLCGLFCVITVLPLIFLAHHTHLVEYCVMLFYMLIITSILLGFFGFFYLFQKYICPEWNDYNFNYYSFYFNYYYVSMDCQCDIWWNSLATFFVLLQALILSASSSS